LAIKRALIAAPLVLVALLLQSWLWIPSYENQTRGNPERITKFIEGSIGDAHFLNPVLSDEQTGSQINALVFDTLLDLDENLALEAQVAERWEVAERAYLAVRPDAVLPDGARATAERLRERVAAALGAEALSVRVLPAETRSERHEVRVPGPDGAPRPADVEVRVRVPERVALELPQVMPHLGERLEPVLGAGYLTGFDAAPLFELPPGPEGDALRPALRDLLPALEHNPVLTFHLRRGITFHDGQPLDAEDVRFTYRAFMDPRNLSPRQSDFEPVKDVEVVDPHTVRVVYRRLFSPAVYVWASYGILPEHLLNPSALAAEMDRRGIRGEARERFGLREAEFSRAPVGSGPFRFVEWKGDDLIHLKRNSAYFEGPPEYEDYYLRIIPDVLTQELEFRTGALDYYLALPQQAARYREDPRYRAFSAIGLAYTYVGYNLRSELFRDPEVRLALGMAIDVDQIIRFVQFGEGERVTGPYAYTTEWYDHSVEPIPYDPARASELLASRGWRRGADGILEKNGVRFAFTLITNNGNPQRKAIATIAQDAWRKIGIDCRVQLFEWAVFIKDFVNTGKFDAVVLGWGTGVDPDQYILWHSSQTGPQQFNFVGYQNPEADRLIEQIRLEYDPERQRALAHALHRRIASDQPYTFLYAPRATTVLDRKIVMVEREPDGSRRLVPPRASPTGQLRYWFTRWKKLDRTPQF
jgi:ABC-type transport system substrate-binding protein